MSSRTKINNKHYQLLLECLKKDDLTEWENLLESFTEPKQILRLRGADFSNIELKGVKFVTPNGESADLADINFQSSILKGCVFDGAFLFDSNFKNTKIEGSNFSNARLQKANFNDSELTMTCFYKADINQGNLENAYFLNCNLQEADLHSCDFSGAKVIGVNLFGGISSSNICGTIFLNAKFTSNTYFVECLVSKDTDFRSLTYNQARYSPGLKQTAEYCNRRHNWTDWYEQNNKLKSLFVFLFWQSSDYGRSITRIVSTFVASSLSFAIIYYFFPSLITGLCSGELLKSIYFSVVTMTTLGFGDMHANPDSTLAQIILIFHVILGYVLLGSLITSLSVLFSSDGPASKLVQLPKGIKVTSFTIKDLK